MKDYYQMQSFFKNKSVFQVRSARGAIKDRIHQGVLKKDLEACFSKGAIRDALKANYLEERQIRLNDGVVRNVYIWIDVDIDEEAPQRNFFKRLVQIVRVFVVTKIRWIADLAFDIRMRIGGD